MEISTKQRFGCFAAAAFLAATMVSAAQAPAAFADELELNSTDSIAAVVEQGEDAEDDFASDLQVPESVDSLEGVDVAEAEDALVGADSSQVDLEKTAALEAGAVVAEEATSKEEASDVALLGTNGWVKDGSDWTYYVDGTQQTGWVVCGTLPGDSTDTGLQRYYLDYNGKLIVSTTFQAALGDTISWFRALAEGYVVRGMYTDAETGYIYLADNDGRLEEAGWLVTDAYGQGIQRYYVDDTAHACTPGYSSDGWDHLTTDQGYVLRGGDVFRGSKYFANNDGVLTVSNWIVTDAFTPGELQRYWAQADGSIATNRLILASEAGWNSYATATGAVARGTVYDSAKHRTYLANNDGVLESGTGWIISDYGYGGQRYYVEQDTDGVYACLDGFSTNGWDHYTLPKYGYVLRGGLEIDGNKYYANNDGVVTVSNWIVTDAFTPGALQRYWAQTDGSFAANRRITAAESGWDAYALSDCTIARGTAVDPDTKYVYLADNDGRLITQTGWVIGDYGYGTQRYWVDLALYACIPGFSEEGWTHYTTALGYVARGKNATADGTHVVVADNDGLLMTMPQEGWLITDQFDGALQRYYCEVVYINPDSSKYYGAKIGFFTVDGINYYGIPAQGYVLREAYALTPEKTLFYADNDGAQQAPESGWLGTKGVAAWNRIKDMRSKTSYFLVVDKYNYHVFAFEGSAGNWTPVHSFLVGIGNEYAYSHGTFEGDWEIGGDGADYLFEEGGGGGPRTEYFASWDVSYFSGYVLDQGFHSIVYSEGPEEDQIGRMISHGCIRMRTADAKWIYFTCPLGTRVIIY